MHLLSRLASAGVTLKATSDGVLLATPKAALTPELRELIRTHKAELLSTLDQLSRAFCGYAEYHRLAPDEGDLEPMYRDPEGWCRYLGQHSGPSK